VLLESSICLADEPLIELGLADTGFVAGNEQDPTPLRVECKSYAPDTAIRPETKFLHVGEGRAIQRIYIRPPKRGTALPQYHQYRKQSVLDVRSKIIKFRFEGRMKIDGPRHLLIMRLSALCSQTHSVRMTRLVAAAAKLATRNNATNCRDLRLW
jgi:hypothetical protein